MTDRQNKEDSHIFFKDLDLLYHLMPSNNLALGLYERGISKRTFQHTTGFFLFREEERRRLSRGDNFLQQARRSGVSRVCGEKVAAARTEKLGTHSHTHTLTHTQDDCYTLAANAYARVMTTKVLSSRPRINAARPIISESTYHIRGIFRGVKILQIGQK